MLKPQLACSLGLVAATLLLVLTVGCSGVSPSTKIVVPPPVSGPHKAQVLLFPALQPSNPVFNDFMTNVLPNVSGVSVSLKWADIEGSNASCTASTGYDFTAFDNLISPYINSGKQVNFIVWPATEGGNNNPSTSGSTPCYIFSTQWAATVGAPNPQDMAVCSIYPGDGGAPTADGYWNINTSPNLSGLPISYEPPFMVGYQNFIKQVISHYNGNASIGYMRFGFSQGGENSPECNPIWPNYSKTVYLNYIQAMTEFVAAQHPTMTILGDLHAVGSTPDFGYPDAEAQYSVQNGMGFGTNGLQQSDLTAGTCDSDWCALFAQYGSTTINGNPITLSLQTLQWSDPTGGAQTGSLVTLIPFAQQHGTNNLELYLVDAALAFSPNYGLYNNYNGYSLNNASYAPAYKQTIQTYLASQ